MSALFHFAKESLNDQCMSSQFCVEPCTQTPKGMRMIDLDVELVGELCVHGLNDLANSVEQMLQESW